MAFPRKFKHLIELELKDVEKPDYVWLVYQVCAVEPDSCGWQGWTLEGAFKDSPVKTFPTGNGDEYLGGKDDQICPNCGRVMYRTGATLRMIPSADQKYPDWEPPGGYVPIEWDE